ncbi:hypothetical protein [Alicyclobacillus dauci]|uniref:Uncharacterized protein n=1 Tax=Alicyclobacillus dauci TaxID=1475485 RepID=A0ABY6YXF0_9BACL|nr:hypothetical protein [Alicyclobacillus dauci]WAH35269.1 hypothetical protein NZD86_13215 [Alicyclobacillus dauci]
MPNGLSPNFIIGSIRIGKIEGASCMNMGNNWVSNFRSFKKHNQGFGSVHGDNNVLRDTRSLLNDPDSIDMVSVSGEELPDWIGKLIQTTK